MTLAAAYWVVLLVWMAFGLWTNVPNGPKGYGGVIMLFLLLAIAGYKLFGPAIKG